MKKISKFKKTKILSGLLLSFCIGTASAQIDSDSFAKLIGTEPVVEINLGAMMLGLLSSATKEEEGVSSILSSLQAINVTVFDIGKSQNINLIRREIKKLAKSQLAIGFETIATIKEDDSLVYILAKMDNEKFNNLIIFALDDDDELVLIDIKGSIHMSQIGELMNHFDVDLELKALEINKQRKKD